MPRRIRTLRRETDKGAPMTAGKIKIRPALPSDKAAIVGVHRQAFADRSNEADLFELLIDAEKDAVSLVAVLDASIVGHVLFSPVTLDPEVVDLRIVGLAPLAVLPGQQGRGVGSRLIREGIAACSDAGFDAVVVLGDPGYYSRFGFERASGFGLRNEYGVDDEFMVLPTDAKALSGRRGLVRYALEFGMAGC